MADLLTHTAVGFGGTLFFRDPRLKVSFLTGIILPDILFKFQYYMLGSPFYFCFFTHSLFGLIFYCYLFCLLINKDIRGMVFLCSYAGAVIHVIVDLFKNYLDRWAVGLFLPFSEKLFELGFYFPEDSVYAMPLAAVVICAIVLIGGKNVFR